jgi:hypothetical protein
MSTPKTVQPARSVRHEDAISMEQPASLDEAIQGAIGRKLRESWDEVVNEEVPDKFRKLLDQLKKSEGSGGSEKESSRSEGSGQGNGGCES